jgi:hypothetical protein
LNPHLDTVSPHGPGFRPMGRVCGDVALSYSIELQIPEACGKSPDTPNPVWHSVEG